MKDNSKRKCCNSWQMINLFILLIIFSVISFATVNAQNINENNSLFDTKDNLGQILKSSCQESVLIGCDTARFTDLPDVTDIRRPEGLAVADLNGDGKLDLVTSGTGQNANLIAVRFGNNDANGSFRSPVYYTAGTLPGAIVVGDFDGINGLDLAVANSSTASRTRLAILLNQGNGTFNNVTQTDCTNNAPNCPGGADQILNIAAARIDNNNSLDLVVSDENSSLVRIYFGIGNGTFISPTVIDFPNAGSQGSKFVTLGDMDGDGDQDLVVALGISTGRVQIKYNDGTGNFPSGQAAVDIAFANPGPKSITIADFNDDGRADFATANTINSANSANSISVKLRNSSGGYSDPVGSPYLLGDFGPNSITTGDFNLDGKLDLATANSTSGSGDGFSVLLGRGDGSFGNPSTSTVTGANPFLIIAGDITGDNRADLILADAANSGLGIGLKKNACDAAVINRRRFDFDGDGKSDLSVFRPDNGAWYIQQSANGFTGLQFGISTDKLVPADYDGDGKTDIAVYRSGIWYLLRSNLGFIGVQFGDGNDIPQPADFDGDGKAELAVFRPSNGTWYVLNLVNNQFTAAQFGQNGDKPVMADYDGDGKADYAVNRNGIWYIQRSSLGFTGVQFGDANDKPVPADYDGDGKTDVAVFRPSNGTWYLLNSQTGFTGIQFGVGTDLPTPADYDGDGKSDIAVFRSGVWYLNRSTAGFTGVQFGTATDKPIPNAFVP